MRRHRSGILVTAIALALAALVTGVIRQGSAQATIDLTGRWDVTVDLLGSPVACAADITQTNDQFGLDLTCDGLGAGEVSGTIDKTTGTFNGTGDIIGLPLAIDGVATADSFSGNYKVVDFGIAGTFTAVRGVTPPTPTPLPTLSSPVDISGTWLITFEGFVGGGCESVIEQSGTELASLADCDILGELRLTGTIDPNTGGFSASEEFGFGAELEGVAADGGNSISGTWTALGLTGTFTGTRADDVELLDLSGSWAVALQGDVNERCTLTIDKALLSSEAQLDCPTLGSQLLTGSVSPLTGRVLLQLTPGTPYDFGLFDGHASEDGNYIVGSWLMDDQTNAPRGSFVAVRQATADLGVFAFSCSEAIVSTSCFARTQEPFSLAVHVVFPPGGGYGGFHADLGWSPDEVALSPKAPQVLATGCGSAPAGSAVVVAFDCAPAGSSTGTFTGAVGRVDVTCTEQSAGAISIAGSTFLDPAGQPMAAPLLIDGAITCYDPHYFGDANCDGATSSVDAAVVLQYDAGLLAGDDCLLDADENGDDSVNSLDAALILQYEAGMLGGPIIID